jgi:MoaA/NifB/PqqE/SkfB family radical SAM enzyme
LRLRQGAGDEFKIYLIMQRITKAQEVRIFREIHKCKLYREKAKYGLAIRKLEKILSRFSLENDPFFCNLVLNEIEINQKKIFLNSKPRQLGVNLTHNCNIHCRMCFYPDSPWDIPKKTVNEIKALLPYLQHVFWQGGEPFVSPYFEELFQEAVANPYLRQTVVTNGLLIDDNWAKKLVSNKATVIYSIDGVTKETFEYIRSGSRFEDLIRSLTTLNKYRKEHFKNKAFYPSDFSIIMQATIMKYNYREIEQFVKFAKEHEIDSMNIIPIQNVYNSENIFYHKDGGALEYLRKTIPLLEQEARRYGIKLYNQLPLDEQLNSSSRRNNSINKINRVLTFIFSRIQNRDNGMLCYWPWYSLFILFAGKTKPYGFCKNDVARDLNATSLEQIWNNEMMQRYRKKIIQKENSGFCESRCISGVIPKSQLGLEMR